jgi:putative membrane protein
MQIERPKIELYKVRSFGDKFSAIFEFIRENFKFLLRACTYLLLPLCLVQGFAMEMMMKVLAPDYTNTFDMGEDVDVTQGMLLRFGSSYVGYGICLLIGSTLLAGICYSMVKYYHKSPNRLRNTTLSDLKPIIIQVIKRSLLMTVVLVALFIGVVVLVISLAAIVSAPILAIIPILALFVCCLPASLALPVYVFEDKETLFSSIARGIKLGFHSFWSLLGLMFVIGFLTNILSSFISIPWYILTVVKSVLLATDTTQSSFAASPVYSFLVYLSSVFMNFGMYLTMTVSTFALAFHYGSIAEEEDGFSVEDDIQHFEELAEKDTDIDNFDKL